MRILMTWLGKAISLGLRVFHRKGTALPGLVIEKLYPRYLNIMLDTLPQGVIIVTGTNGKTTTTKVIVALLRASGLRVLTNPTGTNFVRGIIAALSAQATLTGRLPYDIAVFEQDEAHAVLFARRYQPTGVVALNVMRDQMDRFGEIDTTAKLIGKLVERAKSWAVLNANDRRIAALADTVTQPAKVHWFGHDRALQALFIDDDQLYSDRPMFYQAATPDVALTGAVAGRLRFKLDGKQYDIASQLDGTHNAINAAAALATVLAAAPETDVSEAIKHLQTIRPAFGRGETVRLPGGELRLQLVKNPAGFRHALHAVEGQKFERVGIVINDDYADGRDVSWLWDVDFTVLKGCTDQLLCAGTRGTDMAVRLKYDELDVVGVEPELEAFVDRVAQIRGTAALFCTYTAMLAVRKRLKKYDTALRAEGL